MTALARVGAEGLESVLLNGDLKSLSAEQRVEYYRRVCDSVGLNPLTQPFEFLTLQGKTILYARRACTDQLRQLHRVSVTITSRERIDGLCIVTARATMPDGRTDESVGAVPIEGLKGEALANALMKAETKSKRRVTLAICGLSMLDESELEGVRDKVAPQQQAQVVAMPARTVELEHGEVVEVPAKLSDVSDVDSLKAYAKVHGARFSALSGERRAKALDALYEAAGVVEMPVSEVLVLFGMEA